MNLPLDICDRKDINDNRLQELDKAQDAASAFFYKGKMTDCPLVQTSADITSGDIVEKAVYSQDLIQIHCEKVNCSWARHGSVLEKRILQNASFAIMR